MPSLLHLLAVATTDDVFKSINDQAGGDVNAGQILAVVAGLVGLVVLASTFKRRRDAAPKTTVLHHPSRLLREIAREVGLKRREIRELKKLAQAEGVENPLTLLLCPSLMQAALAKRNAKNGPVPR